MAVFLPEGLPAAEDLFREGAEDHAFPPIVAAGDGSARPHAKARPEVVVESPKVVAGVGFAIVGKIQAFAETHRTVPSRPEPPQSTPLGQRKPFEARPQLRREQHQSATVGAG